MLLIRSSFYIKRTLPLIYSRPCLFHSTIHMKQKQNRDKEYDLRVGFAIVTLQDNIPHFFEKGLIEHSIYSPNVILSDPHYTKLSIHGRTPYLGIAQMLRWSTGLYFDHIKLEITKMRALPNDTTNDDENNENRASFSSIDEMENDIKSKGSVQCLEVRWKLQGTKNPTFFQPEPRIRHIEGVFIYKFDSQGYIGEHRIQRIVPPPSRKVLFMHSLGVRLRSLFWEKRPPVLNPGF
ncbi:uncharacterized protein BX663DRAFT_498178 [Cokeromyces recurvatus]|uniref:uncharacterized protein n=1 Tax=Cokeromyces recurvatus TaxID=90255 RepID=UPI00221F54D0|nr:uncharacterized protein BX663DRAFT_498178 [Cokeromyces recurvatus]KAI7905936.1 hypothetical protein BX663DRAFT_498178 [Cokeromyces recurvatus]